MLTAAYLALALGFLPEAAAVYFDFRTPNGVGNDCVVGVFCESYTFSSDGVKVDVTAETTGPVALVNQDSSHGLGVTSGLLDQTEVDGIVYGEVLNFSFDPEITLDVLSLSLVDWNDDVILLIDGDAVLGGGIDVPGTGITEIDLAVFLPDPLDRTGVVVGLTTADWTDNFKVAAIDVNPALVHTPEPSTVVLVGLGFVMVAFGVRRRTWRAAKSK